MRPKDQPLPTVYRLGQIGNLVIYERGDWHRAQRLPKYVVSNAETGRDLEEFRRLRTALTWADRNAEPPYNPANPPPATGEQVVG